MSEEDSAQALLKGSVRSLPQDRMKDIKKMFDSNNSGASGNAKPGERHNDKESNVKKAQTRFMPKVVDESKLEKPKPPERPDKSPIRKPRSNVSPSRLEATPGGPVPQPRRFLPQKALNFHEIREKRISSASVEKADVAGAEETSNESTNAPNVFQLVEQFKANEEQVLGQLKRFPVPNKNVSVENRYSDASLERRQRHNSPAKIVSMPNTLDHLKVDQEASSKESDDAKKEGKEVTYSVSERTKMFETTPSSPAVKPSRPPLPTRQLSLKESSSTGQSPKLPKVLPSKPVRRASLVEKTQSQEGPNTDNKDTKDKPNCSNSSTPQPTKPQPPLPPSKPPRTHSHDEYVRAKLDKEKDVNGGTRIRVEETDFSPVKTVVFVEDENSTTAQHFNYPSLDKKSRPDRPNRPPPPNKPRPFSIATDTMDFRSSDSSESADDTRSIAPSFYEVLPYEFSEDKDPIKHWDLPRVSHPEPIRRSLSDDCINRSVDDQGNVVYVDVTKIGCLDNYDIYVDTEGYAVPSRLVRRNKDSLSNSMGEKELGLDVPDGPSRPIGDRVKSKFKKFKNLFTDQEKSSSTGGFNRNSSTVRKERIEAIQRKVNQTFDALQSTRTRPVSEIDVDEEEEQGDNLSNESDSLVDEKEIQKRVDYSRSVRFKTAKGINEALERSLNTYNQLFEHAMIVSLELNPEKNVHEPIIKYKFPEIRNYKLTMEGRLVPCSENETKDTNVSVPQFCFPDAANFKPSSSSSTKSQSYNFVLTNIDGGRVYGYCRRHLPMKNQKIPEVICIISPVDAFKMYNTLLEELEKKRHQSLEAATELIAAAFGRPLPLPGKTEIIRTLDEVGEMETIFLTREMDNRIENVACECLLTTLGTEKLLQVFTSILMERSVLFCAKHLSTLSATIHAITSLLYPLSWQHTFIPVLPAAMLDVVCSPTPYIMGITSALLQDALALPLEEHVLVVDLDKKSFVKSQGDEATLLPTKVAKVLKTAINMCKFDSDARQSPDVMISEAFLRFFIEAIGHYGFYIEKNQNCKSSFCKQDFIEGASCKAMEELLKWLVETQMFEVFMRNQQESTTWGNSMYLFQQRTQEHNCNPRNAKRRSVKR